LLPMLDAEGRLPPGRHPATLDEVHDLFVTRAPYRDQREVIFDALRLFLTLVRQLLPKGTVWVNGGFVTHKPWPPHDVDVVVVADAAALNALTADQRDRLLALQTLQGITSRMPAGATSRLQPMGGLVDSFVVAGNNARALAVFDRTWQTVMSQTRVPIPGAAKGYVEVSW
jgi:hypothetical protein